MSNLEKTKTSKPKLDVVAAKEEPAKLLAEIKAQINSLEQKNILLNEQIKTVKIEQPASVIPKANLTPIYFAGSFFLIVVLVFFWVLLHKIKILESNISNFSKKGNNNDKKTTQEADILKKMDFFDKEIKSIKTKIMDDEKITKHLIKKCNENIIILFERFESIPSPQESVSLKNADVILVESKIEKNNCNLATLKVYKAILSAINTMLQKRPTLNPASLPKHLVDNISNDEMQQYIKSMNLEFSLHYLDGASAPSNAELICFKLNETAYVFPHYSSFNNPNLASWFDISKDTLPFGIVELAWVERNNENVITIHEKGKVNT